MENDLLEKINKEAVNRQRELRAKRKELKNEKNI